jgi:hypothetical protein
LASGSTKPSATNSRLAMQPALVLRRQAVGAVPDPVLVLVSRELVEVDHDVPGRLRLAVFRQRGAAPQAARVPVVTPEVPEPVAAAHDAGDLFLGVEDRAQLVARLAEPRPGLDDFARLRVALAHPGEGVVAEDVLQPQVRIVGSGGILRHEGCRGRRRGGRVLESRCADHRRGADRANLLAANGEVAPGRILPDVSVP